MENLSIDLTWKIVIFSVVILFALCLLIIQIKLAKKKNPYYGVIIPFLSSVILYVIVTFEHFMLYFIPFGVYLITYLIARYNYKSTKVEKMKVNIKDL